MHPSLAFANHLRQARRRRAPLATTALALALLAGNALAATPINETRPLNAQGKVEIDNLKGRVEVRTWERNEVQVGGSLGNGVERLDITGDGDKLSIKVRYPRMNARTEPTTLIVRVPQQASLDIEGVSANIDVNGVAGRSLELESVSGNIVAIGAPGSVDAETVSGNLQLNVNTGNASVESVSGNIELRGRISGQISGETVSGKLTIDTRGESPSRITAESVSGGLVVRSGLASGGRIDLETLSGDILLVMPRALSAKASGESFSGRLRATGVDVRKRNHGPGSDFEHTYGTGEGSVELTTFSGNAELRLE